MNCNELKEYISAYVDDELTQTQRDFVEAHTANCADCRALLAEYQAARETLTSLRATPALPDIQEATMAKINTGKLLEKPRRWLKPALVAVPVLAAVVIALSLVFSGSPLSPEEVLAKASAAQQIKPASFGVTIDSDRYNQQTGEWEPELLYEEKISPGKYYHKTTFVSLPSQEGFEIIYAGDTAYYHSFPWGVTSSLQLSTIASMIQQGKERINYQDSSASESSYVDSLLAGNLNGNTQITQLPDETIDGVLCYHFHVVDNGLKTTLSTETIKNSPGWNKLSAEEQEMLLKATERMNEQRQSPNYKTQTDMDIWIGKSDYLVYKTLQLGRIESPNPLTGEITTTNWRGNIIYTYPVEPFSINPPLDAEGKLLPDWYIYSDS
ncbi:MAG: zf-HC2 domain-containing protein [Dehalococcoidales bacterium]|nr:zf-HC2 domain-containing protein [Dehalococcoidales bacterium]